MYLPYLAAVSYPIQQIFILVLLWRVRVSGTWENQVAGWRFVPVAMPQATGRGWTSFAAMLLCPDGCGVLPRFPPPSDPEAGTCANCGSVSYMLLSNARCLEMGRAL